VQVTDRAMLAEATDAAGEKFTRTPMPWMAAGSVFSSRVEGASDLSRTKMGMLIT
jgi:hypothetical protein